MFLLSKKNQFYKPSMAENPFGRNSWDSVLVVLVNHKFKQIALNNIHRDTVKTKVIFRLHKSCIVFRS